MQTDFELVYKIINQYIGPVSEGAVRLVGYTNDPSRGNVQIYHDGLWGAICDHGWDYNDGRVACRQLGYAEISTYHCCSNYGSQPTQIWLSNIGCTGNESSILQCSRSAWNATGSCSYHNTAGVTCLSMAFKLLYYLIEI